MSSSPIVLLQSLDWQAAFRIALAALLGAIVCLETGVGGHPAGLRTKTVIAISSCLFTILSLKGLRLQGSAQDTARVAAQAITGVGFLGTGGRSGTRAEQSVSQEERHGHTNRGDSSFTD